MMHRVERLINRLKQDRHVAPSFEKRVGEWLARLTLAALLLWLRVAGGGRWRREVPQPDGRRGAGQG
jgi:hypothetical protein